MTAVQLNFNANNVQPQQVLEPLPAGWYNAQIIDSEAVPTQSGGTMLKLTLSILDGTYAGRKVFDRLNIQNANEVAVRIAYERLSSYCHATGRMQIQTSAELHGVPISIKLSVRIDRTGQYDPSNEVRAVQQMVQTGGAPGAAPAQAPMMAPAAAPAAPPATAPVAPAMAHAAPAPALSPIHI